MKQIYPAQANSPATALAADITASDTEIAVISASVLSEAPNIAVIGTSDAAETIRYGGKSGNTLTDVTRGFEGEPLAWSAGTIIARNFTAYDYNALAENMEDIANREPVVSITLPGNWPEGGWWYEVKSVGGYSSVLAENTWEQIASASAQGIAHKCWSIGDEKDFTINGSTITAVILGFNHDNLTDGSGKAGITFGMKNLSYNSRRMCITNTNAGGYTASEMYQWMTDTLPPILSPELLSVVKYVDKKTSAGGQSSTIETASMRLFLFSEEEVYGAAAQAASGEGEQYEGFKTESSRIKRMGNGAGDANYWWLRSPRLESSLSFCRVGPDGAVSAAGSSEQYGVCFGFCI